MYHKNLITSSYPIIMALLAAEGVRVIVRQYWYLRGPISAVAKYSCPANLTATYFPTNTVSALGDSI